MGAVALLFAATGFCQSNNNRLKSEVSFPVIDIGNNSTMITESFEELMLFAKGIGGEITVTTDEVLIANSSQRRFLLLIQLRFGDDLPYEGRGYTLNSAAFNVVKDILIRLNDKATTAEAH